MGALDRRRQSPWQGTPQGYELCLWCSLAFRCFFPHHPLGGPPRPSLRAPTCAPGVPGLKGRYTFDLYLSQCFSREKIAVVIAVALAVALAVMPAE